MDVAGIEPATPCLQSVKSNLSNLAGADATRLKVIGYDKTKRAVFLLFIRFLFENCQLLSRAVLRFYYGEKTGRVPASKTGALSA